MSAPLSHLQAHQPPRAFHWRRGRDLQFGTTLACAVVLNGKVYVGGGGADSDKDQFIIKVYTPETDGWGQLPECPVRWFAMAVVNQQLVMVGGNNPGRWLLKALQLGYGDPQSTVLVWDSPSQQWTSPYPDMPTARWAAAAVGYQHFLVVAGGFGRGSYLTTVEILNTSTNQWYYALQTPFTCYLLTLVGDTLYAIGGLDSQQKPIDSQQVVKVVSISVSALVSHATRVPRPFRPTWKVTCIPELQLSTTVSLHNSLLAVGGMETSNRPSSAICLYNPQTNRWTKLGDVPAALYKCSCAVLPSGELVVLGGWGEFEDSKHRRSSNLYIAQI